MGRYLLGVILCLVVSGCHDPDRFLSGQWFSDELSLPEQSGDATRLAQILGCASPDCALYMELNLGHYGQDVVGVMKLYRDENRVSPTTCETEGCSCRSIRGVYRSDNMLRFTFQDCRGCNRTAEIERLSDERLLWTLQMTLPEGPNSAQCTGTQFGDPELQVDIILNKIGNESSLTVSDKACTECRL